ncbi:MAG TPA: TolC family protein [Bryobacteraceae bacterium]|nr:TolC family protein [Bryobacteraceae bacterium]
MNRHQPFAAFFFLISAVSGFAQTSEISVTTPKLPPVVGPLIKPFHFERRTVSPVVLTNSPRLQSLVRAGKLYLSVPDVIALTLENNVDIAIQRYGPFLAHEVLRRAQGGGSLRDFGTAINPGPVSVSLAGVSASNVGLGVSGAGVGSGGGIVVQYGVAPPTLDPFLFAYANFVHSTTPLSNTLLSEIPALVNDSRLYEFGYVQQFVTGAGVQATYYSYRSQINSPANVLNPYTQGYLDLYLTQNLLQGWGISVNNRNIRVAKNNMKVTDLQLKRQVITTVAAILNLYWDLVSFDEDMRIKQRAVATARQLYEDNQHQVKLGTLAPIEVTRAAAEVSSREEDLLIAQTNVSQQETVLKNALSRDGVASAWLDEIEIIPLDRFSTPEKEELKPTPELIQQALASRPEIEQTRINLESSKINIGGTRNELLPTLQAFAELTNNGLTGQANFLGNGAAGAPDPAFVGGYGNMLGQIFRRNFPNYSAGFSLNIPFRNRQAQADYVADVLSLRQSELQLRRTLGQVRVEVKNAIVGLQQARARYETAVATRKLAEQTLDAEQQRFKFAQSTIALVVQAQRDLALDQSAEVESEANYTHAKIAFDEAVGQTLEANGISIEEAASGKVKRQSSLPVSLPESATTGQ